MIGAVLTTTLAYAPGVLRVQNAQPARATTLTMGVESELGATPPLGYWDPLGLSVKNPDKFPRWRAVELKHGRIAMAASTGYIVQEFLRWPGYLSPTAGVKFSELPNGIAAWHQIPMGGIAQFMLFMALMEGITWQYYDIPSRKVGGGKDMFDFVVPAGKSPGDVAGDFWVRYDDPEVKAEKLNIELNNGRAAMLGVTGMLMHDHLLGTWVPPGLGVAAPGAPF